METKKCQHCKNDFEIEETDFNFYQMLTVPPPTLCPTCRLVRRLTWRNERALYKRTCELCKKDVLSVYRVDGGQKVVCQKCWWSDEFDATIYGRDYDFSRPFFDQYRDLMRDVPFVANFIVDESRMVNSPYNNMVLDMRNSYLMFNSDFDEDCAYGCEVENSRNCFDTNLIDQSEMCYESVNLQNCYRAFYSIDCESSSDMWFCRDCSGCTDCFGCTNLRKQSYCIFNEPMGSKEMYQAKLAEFGLSSHENLEEIKGRVLDFLQKGIYKYMHEKQTDDVSGDYIYNSRNTHHSWIVHEGWNVRYSQYLVAPNVKDSYDYTQFGNNVERHYEVLQAGNGGSDIRFSWFVPNENQQIDYSMQVMTSKNMFGCIGLRKKEYCILNKQYSKEDYETLRAKIITHMSEMPYVTKTGETYSYGEFFPSELSPFAYNETTAQEIFPLSKADVTAQGMVWKEKEERSYQISMPSASIPNTIDEISDTITSEIIECENKGDEIKNCTTAFRVIPDEVGFYKRFNIPIPHKCPNCRHRERMTLRNQPIFREAKCSYESCENNFLTGCPDNGRKIYCKEHYLKAVI